MVPKGEHSREWAQRKTFITPGKIKFTYCDDNPVDNIYLSVNVTVVEVAVTNGRVWNPRLSTIKIKSLYA